MDQYLFWLTVFISETIQILAARMKVSASLLRLMVVVAALAAGVSGRMAGRLPGGFGFLPSTFNCDDRPFGYYADVDHGCRAFHVCFPVFTEEGTVRLSLTPGVLESVYFLHCIYCYKQLLKC